MTGRKTAGPLQAGRLASWFVMSYETIFKERGPAAGPPEHPEIRARAHARV